MVHGNSFREVEPQIELHAMPIQCSTEHEFTVKMTKYTRKQVSRGGSQKEEKVIET